MANEKCIDLDECAEKQHDCHAKAKCTNSQVNLVLFTEHKVQLSVQF